VAIREKPCSGHVVIKARREPRRAPMANKKERNRRRVESKSVIGSRKESVADRETRGHCGRIFRNAKRAVRGDEDESRGGSIVMSPKIHCGGLKVET